MKDRLSTATRRTPPRSWLPFYFSLLNIFASIFLFQACSSSGTGDPADSDDLVVYQLQIIDSMEIPVQGRLHVYDYLEDKGLYLADLQPDQHVILFDDRGALQHRITSSKEIPGGWPENIRGVGFVGDTAVAVLGLKAFYIYRLDGSFIKSYPHLPLPPINISEKRQVKLVPLKDSLHLVSNFIHFGQAPAIERLFFETAKQLTAVNLDDGTYKYLGSYDPEGVYLKSKESYPLTNNGMYFDYSPAKDSFWLLTAGGDFLYSYDLDNFSSYHTRYPTFAEHKRPPQRRSYGKYSYASSEEAMKNIRLRSGYEGLWVKEDTALLTYSTGLKDISLNDDLTFEEWRSRSHLLEDRYLQMLARGEKICKDIKVPIPCGHLSSFQGKNKILFKAEVRIMRAEPKGERIYICRLGKVEH